MIDGQFPAHEAVNTLTRIDGQTRFIGFAKTPAVEFANSGRHNLSLYSFRLLFHQDVRSTSHFEAINQ